VVCSLKGFFPKGKMKCLILEIDVFWHKLQNANNIPIAIRIGNQSRIANVAWLGSTSDTIFSPPIRFSNPLINSYKVNTLHFTC